jgi:hypothetical protein
LATDTVHLVEAGGAVLDNAQLVTADRVGRAVSYEEAIAQARTWLEQHLTNGVPGLPQ